MKESAMKRILRFLKGEPLPPNPELDAAIRRAGRKVAKKVKREAVAAGA